MYRTIDEANYPCMHFICPLSVNITKSDIIILTIPDQIKLHFKVSLNFDIRDKFLILCAIFNSQVFYFLKRNQQYFLILNDNTHFVSKNLGDRMSNVTFIDYCLLQNRFRSVPSPSSKRVLGLIGAQ